MANTEITIDVSINVLELKANQKAIDAVGQKLKEQYPNTIIAVDDTLGDDQIVFKGILKVGNYPERLSQVTYSLKDGSMKFETPDKPQPLDRPTGTVIFNHSTST